MDITVCDAHIHVPAEVVNLIISQLKGDIPSLKSARLVCQLWSRSAMAVMSDPWTSPSELFTLPVGRTAYSKDSWPIENPGRKASSPLFTTWTWLEIPASIPIESKETVLGHKFEALFRAPVQAWGGDGRQGSTYGRVRETPNQFWIIHLWPSVKASEDYRASTYARDLRRFLEEVAPECVKASKSERLYLPYNSYRTDPTPCGPREVKTVYFPASMSQEDRRRFDEALHNYPHARYSENGMMILGIPVVGRPVRRLPTTWLPGFQRCDGRLTIARRFIIPCRSLEDVQESPCVTGECQAPHHKGLRAILCRRQLETFGALRVDSLHCKLMAGPWRRGLC